MGSLPTAGHKGWADPVQGGLKMSDDEFETTSNCSKTSKGDEKFAKKKQGVQKNELNNQLKEYINEWRKTREEEEEKVKQEEAEKRAVELEEKKKRLAEAEAKRQEMLAVQKARKEAEKEEKRKAAAAASAGGGEVDCPLHQGEADQHRRHGL